MSRPAAAARVVRNTLANGAGTLAIIAIGVLLTPYMIHQLGLTAYGVWTLALTLTFNGGYTALADLGIEAATARYVAEARSDDDAEAVNSIVATALAFFLVVGAVLGAVMAGAAVLLVNLFSVPDSLHDAAVVCFAIVGGQLVLEVPTRAFVAVLEGAGRFTVFQALELTRALLQGALWVAALIAGFGIGALAAGLAIATATSFVLYWHFARRAVPELRVSPRRANRTELRRLVGYGGSVFVFRTVGTLYRQMDKAILGIAINPAAVGTYEVANKVHLAAASVQSISVSALLPATATARRDEALLRDMFLRGTCYTTAASLPVVIAAFAFAGPLLESWIGSSASGAVSPSRLLLVYLVLTAFLNVGMTMVLTLGIVRPLMVAAVANVAINLVVSIALVGPLGIDGVIIGTLTGTAITWPLYTRLYLRTFGVGWGQWLKRILVPNLPAVAVQGAVLVALVALFGDSHNLLVVGAAITVSIAAFVVTFVARGLPAAERRALLSTVREALGGRSAAPAGG